MNMEAWESLPKQNKKKNSLNSFSCGNEWEKTNVCNKIELFFKISHTGLEN